MCLLKATHEIRSLRNSVHPDGYALLRGHTGHCEIRPRRRNGCIDTAIHPVSPALLAAVSSSIYMVRIDKLAADVNPVVRNALVSLANALTMTVAAGVTGTFRLVVAPSARIAIILMVVVSNVMGFLLFFRSMRFSQRIADRSKSDNAETS
jgi:hypothetical protein